MIKIHTGTMYLEEIIIEEILIIINMMIPLVIHNI